jgi:hypothetical protein
MIKFLQKYYLYLLALLLYVPFIFLGYGSDMDTYRVLWSGQRFITLLDYVPSRSPGFLVFETVTNLLNLVGGSLLTNLGVLCMSLVMIYSFKQILAHYQIPNPTLLILILMIQPFYWVNSTCTMDYLFALGFSFLAFTLLLKGKGVFGGIAIGLAVGSRISAGLTCAGILLFLFLTLPHLRRQMILAGVVASVVGVICFLPTADFVGWNLRFLTPTVGGAEYWSIYLRLGRLFYKSLTFWSIPVALVLLAAGVLAVRQAGTIRRSPYGAIFFFSALMVLAYEAFYFNIPTEPTYLLPSVPFMLILMGVIFKDKRWPLTAMVGLVLLANFVTVDFARPNNVNKATDAVYGLWVSPGHLVEDVQARMILQASNFHFEPLE